MVCNDAVDLVGEVAKCDTIDQAVQSGCSETRGVLKREREEREEVRCARHLALYQPLCILWSIY